MILSFTTVNCQPGRKRIMNLLSSEEATKVKARKIALTSALNIELADGNRKFIKSLVAIGNQVISTWILRHIGIHGNTVVDKEAKDALNDINVHIILILHSK
jgi:hypothetical protein